MKELTEIRKFLKAKSNNKAKNNWRKFVPNSKKVYGVPLSEVNKLVSKYKSGGFELVKELWNDEYIEERILAAKILGKISKKNPELTLNLLNNFTKDIEDWAVCDTLATQAVRPIAKVKQEELLKLSKKLIKSKDPWERRFAIVLLINFKEEKSLKKEVESIIKEAEDNGEKDYYVKKALIWVKENLRVLK